MLTAGTVVVDLMGGDRGPAEVLAGAQAAADAGLPVVVCGTPAVLAGTSLSGLPSGPGIPAAESTARTVHSRPDASIRVAAAAVAATPGSVLLSAGPTGATVSAAVIEMGRAGPTRPVIAARLPRPGGGHVLLVDAGAIPDPSARQMLGGAILAIEHAKGLGCLRPTVGLLSIGREPGAGRDLTRRAHAMLRDLDGFRGNIEPADVLDGVTDVVVADGFVGNILLKTLEAAAGRATMSAPQDALEPDRAAVLLGVSGTVLIAHGAATSEHIASAVALACQSSLARPVSPRQGQERSETEEER